MLHWSKPNPSHPLKASVKRQYPGKKNCTLLKCVSIALALALLGQASPPCFQWQGRTPVTVSPGCWAQACVHPKHSQAVDNPEQQPGTQRSRSQYTDGRTKIVVENVSHGTSDHFWPSSEHHSWPPSHCRSPQQQMEKGLLTRFKKWL